MPIDIEQFEAGDESELRATGRTNAERILAFLSSNREQAFTPSEVQAATEIPRGSVGVVLSRLEDRGLVRHRGDYWAIDPTEDVDTTLSALAAGKTATDRLGPEDPDEWGPGVDDGDER